MSPRRFPGGRASQFRRIATPSMSTFLPLEETLIVSVPLRADVNVVTEMSFLLTVVADLRLIVRSNVEPQ